MEESLGRRKRQTDNRCVIQELYLMLMAASFVPARVATEMVGHSSGNNSFIHFARYATLSMLKKSKFILSHRFS